MSCNPDPLSWGSCIASAVGGAAKAAAKGAFDQIARDFAHTAGHATAWLWGQLNQATAVQIGGPGWGTYLGVTVTLAAVIGVGLFVIQVTVSALRRDTAGLGRAARGLLVAFVAGAGALGIVELLLEAADSISNGIMRIGLGTSDWESVGRKFAALSISSFGSATLLLAALFTCASVVFVWLALMVRKVLLIITAVFAPVAFAGSLSDVTAGWVRKWVEYTVALVASKIVLVMIFVIGLGVLMNNLGERNRIKIRVRAAMAAQARTEGRFLGGRPPYGYRLADAGPHPNPGKAGGGQRLHRLEPDPETAPVVARIFAAYANGDSYAGVARALDREGIPSPSAHDRSRNPHRRQEGWAESAVRAILTNPRYTGRQVWGRQPRQEALIDPADVAAGYTTHQRWADEEHWVRSAVLAQPALVSEELAAAVAARIAARARPAGVRAAHHGDRDYPLRGLLRCGTCGRLMQGTTRQSRPYYRCPTRPQACPGHPSSVYLREAVPVHLVDEWLASALASEAREATAAELAARCGPTAAEQARIEAAKARVLDADRKLARLADAFEAGLSPESYASLDRRYRAEREAALRVAAPAPAAGLSAEEFQAALADAARLSERLGRATAVQRRSIYEALGLSLTWEAESRTLRARVAPRGAEPGVGGGT